MLQLPLNRSKSKGFTLIELMVALAMSLFLIGGMLLIQTSSRTASMESERLSRMQENLRFNSDYLVREMRNAGFRDQLSLTIDEFNQIGNAFAVINDAGDQVTVRYSGRGSCAESFEAGEMLSPGIVENTYFVQNGELRCTGSVNDTTRTVALATGVRDVAFEFICPTATPDCDCSLWVHGDDFAQEEQKLSEACQGIRIGLLFEPIDRAAAADPVAVELSASFRNIVLGNLMWNSIPNPP